MPAAPKHYRAARIAVPRLPLPAILIFAVAGLGGSLFLAYTGSVSSADPIRTVAATSDDVAVYSARAVPFDSSPASVAARAIAAVQTVATGRGESGQTQTDEMAGDQASSEPLLFSEASHRLKGFNRFSSFGAASNSLAVTSTTSGFFAESNAPSYVAPDAEGISAPVPESSTWWYAAALLMSLVVRALHATWRRNHRRTANKINSPRL
ncbi:MAG TPA: hypothetical protein VJU77_07445 [Chthoniobacterales bacterium]|nr:hypothetical protein [Chthoniobacterales bacterium]